MSEAAPSRPAPAGPSAMVIFGAAGDLTSRLLLPALYHLSSEGLLPEAFAIVGYARTDVSEAELRELLRESVVRQAGNGLDRSRLDLLLRRLTYVRGSFDDDEGFDRLEEHLAAVERQAGTGGNRLYYLATAPEYFEEVCARMAARGMLDERDGAWRRVVVEKPFGRDLASAQALNSALRGLMRESQIYRIDHYLGKETVQNILVFRFGNGIFEPVWNRRYVDHVQITVAETLGVETRGGYYDRTGALRDMVPNHLFQLLTFVAMEPPASFRPSALHDEQAKLLQAVTPIDIRQCGVTTVRGQYAGGRVDGRDVAAYTEEPRVDRGSATETFAAFRLTVDNWRWAGVPFYLRTGKRLRKKRSEVVIQFRRAPLSLFRQSVAHESEATNGPDDIHAGRPRGRVPAANQLVLSVQPEESIALEFAAKVPGPAVVTRPVRMRFCYEDAFGVDPRTGYEALLYDALVGDESLFKRADVIELGWAIVDPILKAWEAGACGLGAYASGSDGPGEADAMLARDGNRWRPL